MTESLKKRLQDVREHLGLNTSEMAVTVGLRDRKSWERYERGENTPKAEALSRLVDLGVDAHWLLSGNGAMLAEPQKIGLGAEPDAVLEKDGKRYVVQFKTLRGEAEDSVPFIDDGVDGNTGFVMVPRYDISASAGYGAWVASEQIRDYMAFREDFVRRVLNADPANLALISSIGDSMEPTIRAGDLLLIDRGIDRIIDDAIYVLLKRGELVVKRVQQFFNGAVTIKSDSDSYIDETLTSEDVAQITVAGRVRWVGRLI